MKIEYMWYRVSALYIFSILFLLLPGIAQSDTDLPDDNLGYPVLLISKDGTGSGFYYNKDDATYLITARHVLFKETSAIVPASFEIPSSLLRKCYLVEVPKDKEIKEFRLNFLGVMLEKERDELIKVAPQSDIFKKAINQLYKESQQLRIKSEKISLISYAPKSKGGPGVNELELQMKTLNANGHIKYHPSYDVASIKIGTPKSTEGQLMMVPLKGITKKLAMGIVGVGKDNFKLFKDVIVGNQVFIFGYPTSITRVDPWLDIKMPLLRKGIVAGKNDTLNAIILDCPAYNGNSGGLALEVERTGLEINYKAIGVITNLVPFANKLWMQNSGYSIVVPMDYVEELISGQIK